MVVKYGIKDSLQVWVVGELDKVGKVEGYNKETVIIV